MCSAVIHYSGCTLAQINTDVTLCADNVSGSAGEEEVRTSGNLAGADLVTAASTAANAQGRRLLMNPTLPPARAVAHRARERIGPNRARV